MKKILVLAYQISPTRGSEYSVAWNYVIEMSKDNELLVLYGASGEHMGDCEEMEMFEKEGSLKNVQFISIKPNRLTTLLNSLNKRGALIYTFYWAYNIWHRQAFKKAKELIRKEKFDMIHFLNPIGYREPGYLWKLGLPYVWGPVGGINNVSSLFFPILPIVYRLRFGFRTIANYIQFRTKRRLIKALKHVDLFFTATTENQLAFKKVHKKDSIYIPENSIISNYDIDRSKFINEDKVNLIFIGSIDARKALIILLKALCKINDKSKIVLHVVGDGPLKNDMQNFSMENGLNEMIVWHGKISRDRVLMLLNKAHLNIITSVSEGNPTTVWEAMSVGVPTLSIDHCGMHDTINEKSGIKIPLKSCSQIIDDIAKAINKCVETPSLLEELAIGTIECAKKNTWEQRRIYLNKLFDEMLEKKKS